MELGFDEVGDRVQPPSSASGPSDSARRSSSPERAASIINPMIRAASKRFGRPWRPCTSASNSPAQRTNGLAARACSPRLLVIRKPPCAARVRAFAVSRSAPAAQDLGCDWRCISVPRPSLPRRNQPTLALPLVDASSDQGIGRLAPAMTSMLPLSRIEIARFEGVPPNMSVSTMTPRPASVACTLSRMSWRRRPLSSSRVDADRRDGAHAVPRRVRERSEVRRPIGRGLRGPARSGGLFLCRLAWNSASRSDAPCAPIPGRGPPIALGPSVGFPSLPDSLAVPTEYPDDGA